MLHRVVPSFSVRRHGLLAFILTLPCHDITHGRHSHVGVAVITTVISVRLSHIWWILISIRLWLHFIFCCDCPVQSNSSRTYLSSVWSKQVLWCWFCHSYCISWVLVIRTLLLTGYDTTWTSREVRLSQCSLVYWLRHACPRVSRTKAGHTTI